MDWNKLVKSRVELEIMWQLWWTSGYNDEREFHEVSGSHSVSQLHEVAVYFFLQEFPKLYSAVHSTNNIAVYITK
jgi:hypothetical protein